MISNKFISNSSCAILIVGGNNITRDKKTEELLVSRKITISNNPDYLTISSETSIGIEDIRKLQSWLSLKPFSEKTKVAFINESQNLTTEAQNALLKTLEEPNDSSLIILTAPETSWLLPTVVSRCQIIKLPFENPKIKKEEFVKRQELLNKLIKSSVQKRFAVLEQEGTFKDRETAILWVDEMTHMSRELMIESTNIDYLHILSNLIQAKKYLSANCNVRLTLENFLLDLTS